MKAKLVKEAQSVYDWGRRNGGNKELSCWCAICSYELFKRFRRQGLNPTFYNVSEKNGWDGHCFVYCLGYIVDVTAAQFVKGLQPVEVRKTDLGYWFWAKESNRHVNVKKANSTARIRKLLIDWPKCQNPFRVDFKRDWA